MASESAVSAFVYHKDEDGVLHPYDRKTSEAILAAAVQGSGLLIQPRSFLSAKSPKFDLKRMKQLKSGVFEEEDIIIDIPWTARSLRAAVSLNAGVSFRRKVLEMALNRIRGQESLSTILDIKDVPDRSIRENPNLGPRHLPYDNFVASLATATQASIPYEESSCEMLFDALLETASDPTESNLLLLESEGLRIVFHGTNYDLQH